MTVSGTLGRRLRSPALAVALLLAIALMAAAGSAVAPRLPPDPARPAAPASPGIARILGLDRPFASPLFLGAIALAAVNVSLCTWHRCVPRGGTRRLTLRTGSDIALHASLILVLAGAAAKGALGTVRTQRVAVDTETAAMYDWQSGRDEPLGFSVRVEELRESRFPARVRLGVRDAVTGEKLALLALEEGRAAAVPGTAVRLELLGYDPTAGVLRVAATGPDGRKDVLLGTRAGAAERDAGGYRLTVVAWRSDVRSARVRVTVREEGKKVAEGWLEPNGRLRHRGTSLFMTSWGNDEFGLPFCGIQAVRDPGAPLFWAGCILLALAIPLHQFSRRR